MGLNYIGILNKRLRAIRNDFKVLLGRAVIINSSTNITYDGDIIPANWGDDINYYFLREILRKDVVMYSECILARYLQKNYLFIGSTLSLCSNCRSIVWGAGFLNEHFPQNFSVNNIYAVRGPLSRQLLLDKGFVCPEIYGDPAMLIKLHYKPNATKKYSLGIIPNYDDIESVNRYAICPTVKIISPRGYNHWHEFIDEINNCNCVVSSSLHGIIIAESYGVPSRWVEFENGAALDYFKFNDFYLSINKAIEKPYIVSYETTADELISECAQWHPGHIDLAKLIETCPLELKIRCNA